MSQILLLCWLRLLLIAVHKALVVGHIEDHRSDSEDEGEHKPAATRQKKPAPLERSSTPARDPLMDVNASPFELKSPPVPDSFDDSGSNSNNVNSASNNNSSNSKGSTTGAVTPGKQEASEGEGNTPSVSSGGVRNRRRRVD